MISNNENETYLSKIINDPIFSASELYQNILRYLFACYNQNYRPTEIEIAMQVFGKKEHFDPGEDTLVRVYFYRLRKKMDQYYNGSGKQDLVKVTIPKGHHYLEFVSVTFSAERWWKRLLTKNNIFIASLVVMLIIIVSLLIQNKNLQQSRKILNHFASENIIWSDFINNKLKTIIVIGDLFSFYYHQKDLNREWLIRDDQINSYNELSTFLANSHLDQSKFYLPGWDIVPKPALVHVLSISKLLSYPKIPIEVKITSEVTLEDIRQSNLIFIGHFHNLKHLGSYLPKTHFIPSTVYSQNWQHPTRHMRAVSTSFDTLYPVIDHYSVASGINSDYVHVARVPGPNNNVFLFFISFQSLGRLEVIKILSDEKLFSQLTKELSKSSTPITPFFEMLVEVKGPRETGFETQIKHFFSITPESRSGHQ